MAKTILNASQYNFSWYDFYKNTINLKKYKIPQLKQIASINRLYVSGTKSVLINRIENHFKIVKNVAKIQAWIRRFLVMLSFKLRGPAFKDRSICVNSSDFYTMEPLNEIEFDDFFSYTDEKGFTYGFQIDSLIQLFKKTGTITNPYNRDQLDYNVVRNIIKLFKINYYIFEINKHQKKSICCHSSSSHNSRAAPLNNIAFSGFPQAVDLLHNTNDTQTDENVFINMSQPETGYSFMRERTIQKLNEMRQKDENQRIIELFIEIDLLGNYTQCEWFSELIEDNVVRFMQKLYEIWNYRSNMSYIVKMQLCPFFNPFLFNVVRNEEFDENIRQNCITILENIIFSGGDTEYRKIGAMHILTALTLVSGPARRSLPWLFESVN